MLRHYSNKNIKTTLEAITTANGYDNTVESVQREEVYGQDMAVMHVIIILQGSETKIREIEPNIIRKMIVPITVITQRQEEDPMSSGEIKNSFQADNVKAMSLDVTRGNNAIDTHLEEVEDPPPIEGSVDVQLFVLFSIDYQHRRDDPKLK